MSTHYGVIDPLSGIVSDGLIFYIHPALKSSYDQGVLNDLVDQQNCTVNGTDIHTDGEKFVFNGTDDWIDTNRTYIDDGTYSISQVISDYTLEAWIYVISSSGTTTSADSIIGNGSSYGVGMQVGNNDAIPRINFGARSSSNFYNTQSLAYNTWYHVVWAHDYGVTSKVYINNVLDTTSVGTSYNIVAGVWDNMSVGYSGPRISGYFDGWMGPVRIYNRALTDLEVTKNFNASRKRYGL